MNEGEKVNVSIFNWGPCVIKLKITDELKNILLEGGKKSTEDFRGKLAGILDNEKGYSEETIKKVLPFMSQYLGVYDQMYQKFTGKVFDKKPEYVISAVWINYQKQNEFNPPHDHDGKLLCNLSIFFSRRRRYIYISCMVKTLGCTLQVRL